MSTTTTTTIADLLVLSFINHSNRLSMVEVVRILNWSLARL